MFFLLAFGSGLTFLLTLSTLSLWLADIGVESKYIGMMSFITIPYSFKFLLAPFIDSSNVKNWLKVSLIGQFISIIAISLHNPLDSLVLTAVFGFIIAVFSSVHDIIIDKIRIENKMAKGKSCALESIGFRSGMLVSGAITVYIASFFSWKVAYIVMSIYPLTALFFLKKFIFKTNIPSERFSFGFIKDFKIHILVLLLCFKCVDSSLNSMLPTYFVENGISKIDYANVSKISGSILMIIGAGIAGIFIQKMGTIKSVYITIIMQFISSALFLIHDKNTILLFVGISSFASGFTGTIFLSLVSKFCFGSHTASKFTVLYSLGSVGRIIFSTFSGFIVSNAGYQMLFLYIALLTIFLIMTTAKVSKEERLQKALRENLKKRKATSTDEKVITEIKKKRQNTKT